MLGSTIAMALDFRAMLSTRSRVDMRGCSWETGRDGGGGGEGEGKGDEGRRVW